MITKDNLEEHIKEFGLRTSLIEAKSYFGNNKKDLIGAELGVDVGNNAESMLKHLDIKLLHLIDSYDRGHLYDPVKLPYEKCKERVDNYNVVFHIKTTKEAVNEIDDSSLDFCYVDADHSYTACLEDCILYYPKVMSGGVICGHDYNMDSVKKAVGEFALGIEKEVNFDGMDWWIFK